ncbi:hypothetical protein BDV06DRAFT_215031 [Aspergillus oleicola]
METPSKSQISNQATSPSHEARLLCRHNLATKTAGLAPGYLQANLVVLPYVYAGDFKNLCARNPVPCPLLGFTPTGNPNKVIPEECIKTPDFDIRTDFPGYVVHTPDGGIQLKKDILNEWTDDHVGFLVGCSFSFEDALLQNGLKICHQLANKLPAMYVTNIPLLASGVFHGSTFVVSMRTYQPGEIEKVRDVTRPYLATHGEPIAWGWDGARAIGVADIDRVDFGDRQDFEDGEIPVFWACGVTPQVAVRNASSRIEGVTMAHEPGHMLVTDWTVEDLPEIASKITSITA